MNKVHISLNVANVDESQKFYESFLNEAVNKVRPGYANFELNDPPLKLALQSGKTNLKEESKVSHLGIQVPSSEEVNSTVKRLRAAGFHLKEEMGEVCCYAKADKVWVQDPDGNRWEVYTVTDELEDLEENSCSTTQNQTSCC
ncbi:MAG: glyoxalase/bleomycin resistance/extradiol dioxygenase family protein [Candidatus Marinimicrobia bacterium]|jgi:catechol 2,3-dioxygenase-like lactoylglutathione lyase family enzyme|nr:glyoxalase/bleomycin resistance/extradiol dioxygenase family protein [Candidatus Neomarinimicrobiota bacterium]MBT3502594.1 glyoxalase/bleomycin resistance/extradiol dioxygenase family protein [Candidatus Neomarinimicrobiota bacterium]MBT3839248.1 glyoxalase/bleomycin resistance/extradiol dioxygenase family protein [Candidatus Neomarinimicrobiota bacterium]MBT3999209.1 glyoxalase/bleomycin resistance/extradiol dioxygenase family protein [Candidatus Neomarinimicrobiota bacterium]MBT4281909.1 